GHMTLEVETESTPVSESGELATELGRKALVIEADLSDEVVQTRHLVVSLIRGIDGHCATCKRGEDALMGLTRQVSVTGLAEGSARTCGRLDEQRVQSWTGHD